MRRTLPTASCRRPGRSPICAGRGAFASTAEWSRGVVTPYYDPMIAKLIVHAPDRRAAAARLAEACGRVEAWPVRTNAAFLARAAADPDFVAGHVDTGFIARHQAELVPTGKPEPVLDRRGGRCAGAAGWSRSMGCTQGLSAQRGGGAPRRRPYRRGNASCRCCARCGAHRRRRRRAGGLSRWRGLVLRSARCEPGRWRRCGRRRCGAGSHAGPHRGGGGDRGQAVSAGQRLVVIEAMKMEQALTAPFAGVVARLEAAPGAQVSEGRCSPGSRGRAEHGGPLFRGLAGRRPHRP